MHHYPRKRFGQHFLHETAIIQRIITAIAPEEGVPIIEIGPGHGALTIPLLERMQALDVVEIDRDLARTLTQKCKDIGTLHMHIGDALELDFRALVRGKKKIIGNLPYNISTPLLFHLLAQLDCIEEMIFMMQQEVVDRICAESGSHEYGRLTVMVQSCCQAEKLFTIGPGAFTPPPRVDSCVIRLKPRSPAAIPIEDTSLFNQVVRQAFNHRRKTIRNSLQGLVNESQLKHLGISPTSRAENLTVQDYLAIADLLYALDNQ